jgi:cytochrome c553
MKINIVLAAALSLTVSPLAQAEEPGFRWSRATLTLIESGDAARGAEVAEKQRCAKCHEDNGVSTDIDIPSIAGQTASYTFKQLVDYKSGAREDRDMQKAARKLTPEEMADLAAFYATLQPPQQAPDTAVPALVKAGDLTRLLLPCGVCHGREGEGYGYETPALAGQSYGYMVNTLLAFRAGERVNDHYGRKRFITRQLTEEEIKGLAAYYAAPPPKD